MAICLRRLNNGEVPVIIKEVTTEAYGNNGNKGDRNEVVRCPGEHDARVTAYSRIADDAINAVNNV